MLVNDENEERACIIISKIRRSRILRGSRKIRDLPYFTGVLTIGADLSEILGGAQAVHSGRPAIYENL